MKFIDLGLSLALAGLMVAPAFAQEAPTTPRFYGGLELGLSTLNDSTAETSTAFVAALGGTASGTQDTSGSAIRVFGGYHMSQTVSFELGYQQFSAVSQRITGVTIGAQAYTGSASVTTSGLDYSVLLRPGRALNGNGVFLRLGGHYLTANGSSTLTGVSTVSVSSSVNGSGFLWGAGYDMPLQDKYSIRFEYIGLKTIAGKAGTADNFSLGVTTKF